MKSKKIIILLMFFLTTLFLINVDSYGFSEGDRVKCKVFSYYYVQDWSNGVNPYLRGYKRQDEENRLGLQKNTQVTFIKSMGEDGICEIEYNGKRHYIKEVNLTMASTGTVPERASRIALEKYKGKTVNDFVGMGNDRLKSASDECKIAYDMAYDTQTKLELHKIITDMAEAARRLRMQVNENNEIDHQIPEGSSVSSGTDVWQNNINEANEQIITEAEAGGESNERIFKSPDRVSSTDSSGSSLDDMIGDADSFVGRATNGIGAIEESDLQNFSNSFYNILLVVGTATSVIIGLIIGIKFMLSSVEEKAEVKKMIVPYLIGCIVVYGGFGIWKIIVELLQQV